MPIPIAPVGAAITTVVSAQTILHFHLADPNQTPCHDQMVLGRASQPLESHRHLRDLNDQPVRAVETGRHGMLVHPVRAGMTCQTWTICGIICRPKKSQTRDPDIDPGITIYPRLPTLAPAAILTTLTRGNQHGIYPRPLHAAAIDITTLTFLRRLNHTRTALPSSTQVMNAFIPDIQV